jgi:hypothetical protein
VLHSPSRLRTFVQDCFPAQTPLSSGLTLCFTVTLYLAALELGVARTDICLSSHQLSLTCTRSSASAIGLTFTSRTSSPLKGRTSITRRSATRKQHSLIRHTGCVRITKHSHRNTTRLRTPLPAVTNRPRLTRPLLSTSITLLSTASTRQRSQPSYDPLLRNTTSTPCTSSSSRCCSQSRVSQPQPTSRSPHSHRASTTSPRHVARSTRLPSTAARRLTSPPAQHAVFSASRAWCG